ncbi:MAG: hypothetical protein L6365_05680 [Desulfobulbaceae bacterium]|nr:hypothetical protein [Pseudomonadota bacterium]MCG2747003.1 hypothetical protein [Desulfobulbaceae bacterium]
MVEAAVLKHNITWTAPMPLWAENTSLGIQVRGKELEKQPVILRFAHDSFMEELLSVLAESPWRLSDWIAQPETWREPMKAPQSVPKPKTLKPLSYLLHKTKELSQKNTASKKRKPPRDRKHFTQSPEGNDPKSALKLYQAAHQRYYLVTASLLDDVGNYPERTLNLSRNERVTFVMRRLIPPSTKELKDFTKWDEYAYVSTGNGYVWKKVVTDGSTAARKLICGEEQLPLFPLNYNGQCGKHRQLHAGLIPVGKREAWLAAPVGETAQNQDIATTGQSEEAATPLAMSIFKQDISTPWQILLEQALNTQNSLNDDGDAADDNQKLINNRREQIQTVSWYILLDFVLYLQRYLPRIWSVIAGQTQKSSLDNEEQKFVTYLEQTSLSDDLAEELTRLEADIPDPTGYYTEAHVKRSLSEALAAYDKQVQRDLETVDTFYERFDQNNEPIKINDIDPGWPTFLFPLADPILDGPIPPLETDAMANLTGIELLQEKVNELAAEIEKILPEEAQAEIDELVSTQPIANPGEAWFVVRCVYERPNCGPLFPALTSAATRRFQLAPFFDPDAPARPVRIPMPLDISPAGLRKFKKNAGFIMSDMLCGKIKRIRKITLGDLVLSVLPWPFHKDLPDPGKTGPCSGGDGNFGMICSLSIPIVTLCALILLIIIVSLFDIFFRWIPYLFICLPIPGLKGKK